MKTERHCCVVSSLLSSGLELCVNCVIAAFSAPKVNRLGSTRLGASEELAAAADRRSVVAVGCPPH